MCLLSTTVTPAERSCFSIMQFWHQQSALKFYKTFQRQVIESLIITGLYTFVFRTLTFKYVNCLAQDHCHWSQSLGDLPLLQTLSVCVCVILLAALVSLHQRSLATHSLSSCQRSRNQSDLSFNTSTKFHKNQTDNNRDMSYKSGTVTQTNKLVLY